MKKRTLLFCLLLILLSVCLSADDSLSTTEFTEQITALGIPTVESVKKLEAEASAAYTNKDWQNAAEKFESLAKQANFLANIIAQGLEPYYSADYDDRKAFPSSSIRRIVPDETFANSFKNSRNIAFLRQGICFYNLQKYDEALPLIMKALDFISIEDTTLWNEARLYLYQIIGYKEHQTII